MTGAATKRVLDLNKTNPLLDPLFVKFKSKLVGQDAAATKLIQVVETHLSGHGIPGRPAGSILLLGPTGSGKTYAVETLCEGLVGDPRACIKIDCAEFQHSHEIAKLIGSPPGYLGHRETHPLLTQEALSQFHKDGMKLSVLLFDEIEKASDSLWQLLLGILDKSTLTLGDNRKVNFDNVIIVLTSNLGAKQMHAKKYGFNLKDEIVLLDDAKNEKTAMDAAKRHFTPEFMNRIDKVVVFKTLTEYHIAKIMMLELGAVQTVMFAKDKFVFQLTPAAKTRIMAEGYSIEYGARALKRVIERLVRAPLARLAFGGQIVAGDAVVIDEVGTEDFEFTIGKLTHTQVKFTDVDGGDIL